MFLRAGDAGQDTPRVATVDFNDCSFFPERIHISEQSLQVAEIRPDKFSAIDCAVFTVLFKDAQRMVLASVKI